MNKMMITVTNKYINIKCKTDDEIKDYIKKSDGERVEVYEYKRCIRYVFRTVHHPDIYISEKNTVNIYIDGETDEWTFPLRKIGGEFTREAIERLIPSIKEALQMLKDKVYNTQHYIIEF